VLGPSSFGGRADPAGVGAGRPASGFPGRGAVVAWPGIDPGLGAHGTPQPPWLHQGR
jgi:hypothetical protein